MDRGGRGDNEGTGGDKKRVLCVGNSCVDYVNIAREYPDEDTDQRGLEYYWQRGGNASNSCTVLSILSIPCEYLGVLGSQGVEASWVKTDFDECGIVTTNCVVKPVQCPIATIVISQSTGSRTILFYHMDRPELTYAEFHEIFHGDFSPYSWLHFELRKNVTDISHMISDVASYNARTCSSSEGQREKVIISLEIERPEHEDSESVMSGADVVFISKDFAKSKGFTNQSAAVEGLYHFCKDGAVLICAWGDVGAAAHCRGTTVMAAALTDIKVIDTLGAGDTFIAGVISYLWKHGWTSDGPVDTSDGPVDTSDGPVDTSDGPVDTSDGPVDTVNSDIRSAIEFGCLVAGHKCTMSGYRGLRQFLSKIL